MTRTQHILLLAGGGEASQIAAALADWPDLRVTASRMKTARAAPDLAVPTRVGGFGGAEGFHAFLAAQGITAVLDATHSFAARISHRTARICADLKMPYAQVLRSEWQAGPGDRWTHVADLADIVLPKGARAFCTTGRESLHHLAALPDSHFLLRITGSPSDLPELSNITFVPGDPPFSVQDEINLFEKLQVTHLIVKNSGGMAGASKLQAARHLGLPVILLDRPVQPAGPKLADTQDALDWVRGL